MTTSMTMDIDMPDDFPTAAYDTVCKRLVAQQMQQPALWREFTASWNAVVFRFMATSRADEAFTTAVRKEHSPPMAARQFQEDYLYMFFVGGLSVIESFAYASFAIGAMLQPTSFKMATPKHLKLISPKETSKVYSYCYSREKVSDALSALLADEKFKKWQSVRNYLAHRSSGLRHHVLSRGPEGTVWEVGGGLTVNDQTTRTFRLWLGTSLTGLVGALNEFTETHLSAEV